MRDPTKGHATKDMQIACWEAFEMLKSLGYFKRKEKCYYKRNVLFYIENTVYFHSIRYYINITCCKWSTLNIHIVQYTVASNFLLLVFSDTIGPTFANQNEAAGKILQSPTNHHSLYEFRYFCNIYQNAENVQDITLLRYIWRIRW